MSEKSKLAINSISLLINRMVQGVTSFMLTAAIARSLGAGELGKYILAMSYYYMFVNLASQGLKTLFTRELARDPETTSICLVSGTLLQLILSIIGYIALVITVFVLPYDQDTSVLCYITGLTIIPFALSNITEAILQSQEKMHLIAFSTVPVYILRVFVIIGAIQLNYGIKYVVGIFVISETLILLLRWVLLLKMVKPKWQIDKNFIFRNLYGSRTLFAIEGLGIIANRMDILIISLLGSEALVGIYGAVLQLLQPFYIIANSVTLSGLPKMSKAVNLGKENQRQVTQSIITILLIMALPFMLGILFFSKELIFFVYKNPSFSDASVILNLQSLILILFSFAQVSSYLLVASNFEKFNLISSFFSTIIGGLAGIFFIAHYKLMGAALMHLMMVISHFGIMIYAVYTKLFSFQLWLIFRLPLIVSSLMLGVFLILKNINLDFSLTLFFSTLAYLLIVSCIAIKEFGGLTFAWKKLLNKN